MNRLSPLTKIVLALLLIWGAMSVIGFVIRGLFFLFVIGLVLFGFTLAGEGRRRGYLRRR